MVKPSLAKGESLTAGVERRARVASLRHELNAVASAPMPVAALKQRMREQVHVLAQRGAVRVAADGELVWPLHRLRLDVFVRPPPPAEPKKPKPVDTRDPWARAIAERNASVARVAQVVPSPPPGEGGSGFASSMEVDTPATLIGGRPRGATRSRDRATACIRSSRMGTTKDAAALGAIFDSARAKGWLPPDLRPSAMRPEAAEQQRILTEQIVIEAEAAGLTSLVEQEQRAEEIRNLCAVAEVDPAPFLADASMALADVRKKLTDLRAEADEKLAIRSCRRADVVDDDGPSGRRLGALPASPTMRAASADEGKRALDDAIAEQNAKVSR
jgi:hypothetical protein